MILSSSDLQSLNCLEYPPTFGFLFACQKSPILDTELGIYSDQEISQEKFDEIIKCLKQKLDPQGFNINKMIHYRGSITFNHLYFHPLHMMIQTSCTEKNQKWFYKMIQFLFSNGATVKSMTQFPESGFYTSLYSFPLFFKKKIVQLFLKHGVFIESGLKNFVPDVLDPYFIYFFFI